MELAIHWQRLVNEEGKTCDRCGGTEEEIHRAVADLASSLSSLGIRVVLREEELSPQEFAKEPGESNRVWVAERPLEEWLEGEVGMSPCAFCCSEIEGASDCRTLSVEGETYEVIPARMIVKAGLLAASEIIPAAPSPATCCPVNGNAGQEEEGCCPGVKTDKR
ncbi:MAG: DUF2703 domain-containing protein [Candidatus Eisenbacteria bacterium]|nr:DUF2703 domain-containing protein [Candidatus Eisenbacteria bacterium]